MASSHALPDGPVPRTGPPFRLIAIVPTLERARRVLETIASLDRARPIGLMIRDPGHDPARVAAMLEALAADIAQASDRPAEARPSGVPPDSRVVLIANGIASPSAPVVHLPFAMAGSAEQLAGMGYRVGVSVHSVEEATMLDGCVDYLIASPVFPTASKPGHPGIGLDRLRAICSAVTAPVFGLGGVTAATADACLAQGAHGIAAISAFDDPTSARALVNVVDRTLATTSESRDAARR